MISFLLFYALMTVQYALVAINTRMVAQGRYGGTAVSDALIAVLGFALIQHVAAADTLYAQAGYVLGGVTGGVLGVWLSRSR